jgi:hypothetical protein
VCYSLKKVWKQGDALSLLLFNFDLEYAIWRVPAKGLKLNGTHQLLFHADDINILGSSIHSINKTTEALEVTSWETALDVSADKTRCMVMSQDKNSRQYHSIQIDNEPSETVEHFRYLI